MWRSLIFSRLAASICVICFCLTSCSTRSRSRSRSLKAIRSVSIGPSATHESGHFYFAQIGHSHFAATAPSSALMRPSRRSRILATLNLAGTVQPGTEDLLIDGSVEGLIQLEGRRLTVGAAAKVTADINARDVVVYGYVKGNIRAKGRVEIKKDGSVIGNLTTAQIMIEDGADFKGSIEIDRGVGEEDDKNVSSRAAGVGAKSI